LQTQCFNGIPAELLKCHGFLVSILQTSYAIVVEKRIALLKNRVADPEPESESKDVGGLWGPQE